MLGEEVEGWLEVDGVRGWRGEVEGEECVVDGGFGVFGVGRVGGKGLRWRGGLGFEGFVDAVAVPSLLLVILSRGGLAVSSLFCLCVVLHLEDVYFQGLLMVAHVTKNDGLGFVKPRV